MKLQAKRTKVLHQALSAFQDDEEEQQEVPSTTVTDEATLQLKSQGQNYAEQEDWCKSLSCFDEAISLSPPRIVHAELLEMRAQVLMQLGRDFEAIQSATKASTLDPASIATFLTLGRAQLNYGEAQLALKSFQKALQLQPDHAEVKAELATVQMLALQQQQAGGGRRIAVKDSLGST